MINQPQNPTLSTKDFNILIVDDEQDLREIIAFDFESEGFNTANVEDGQAGLRALEKDKFDIVISDIKMPKLNGLQFLEAVKKNNVDLPHMIFITGYFDVTIDEVYDRGAEGFFEKPFDRRSLVAHTKWLLTDKKLRWSQKIQKTPNIHYYGQAYQSLPSAIEKNCVNLGRGGIFIGADQPKWQPEDIVEFDFNFQEGDVRDIKGVGIVRWVRKQAPQMILPPGVGVEILSLDSSSMGPVLDYIEGSNKICFIPKK